MIRHWWLIPLAMGASALQAYAWLSLVPGWWGLLPTGVCAVALSWAANRLDEALP